ncbi:HAMP domain-containing sensor histidine kinase [Terrabacter sp. NPDC000476]|uniref:sensor histidine kinase n=1 Tax=Terrabacter sp. NPDC000476 TaxID=3154258 RepID=UPI003322EBEB
MRNRMLWVSVGVASVCSAAMIALPGSETVPYHVAWATFALCFGLAPWSPVATWWTLGGFTLVTGSILVHRVLDGVLEWQETTEVPLMLTLMLLMVWHVRRRQSALAAFTALADREREAARTREVLTQRTSHEMRSPLTIARGYLEAIAARPLDAEVAADVRVVEEELARLTRVCERLVRSMRVTADLDMSRVDVDALVRSTAERWSTVVDRDWRVDAWGGSLWGSPERLRACLDTLVENAVRYTREGDTVELFVRLTGDETIAIGVADSGPGFAPEVLAAGAPGGAGTHSGSDGLGAGLVRDELSQTGLGISLVRDAAGRRGGRVQLGTSRWGGAEVAMVVPRQPSVHEQLGSGTVATFPPHHHHDAGEVRVTTP